MHPETCLYTTLIPSSPLSVNLYPSDMAEAIYVASKWSRLIVARFNSFSGHLAFLVGW